MKVCELLIITVVRFMKRNFDLEFESFPRILSLFVAVLIRHEASHKRDDGFQLTLQYHWGTGLDSCSTE